MVSYTPSPKEAQFTALYTPAWQEMINGKRPVKEILDQLASEATKLVTSR